MGDDLYLVGQLDEYGSHESDDHEHVPQPFLFLVEHDVAERLPAALRKRFEGYSA